MTSGVSRVARSNSFRPYRSFGATVSGSLARGTRGLSPNTSRRFPMLFGDTVDATCARIYYLDAATAACTIRRS